MTNYRTLAILLLAWLAASPATAQDYLHAITFNMRYDNPKDSPNHWQARKDKVAAQILFHDADVVGTQEMLHHQTTDLLMLLPAYAYIGAGRDDGRQQGEYSGILYNKNTLRVLDQQNFWLSLTPEIPGSKSWDAAITRMVTWAKFQHKASGKIFYHFNTHFDHIGKEARRQSAIILLQQIGAIAGHTPAIVTGDFNARPDDEPMRIIFDKTSPLVLTDTKSMSETAHYGPQGTFTAFGPKEIDNVPIDYMLTKGKWRVLKHATLSQSWQGLYASDHFAVYALLQLLQ